MKNNVNIVLQSDCMTSELKGLRSQLCAIDYSLKDLQKKASEVVSINIIMYLI